jgi:site-specific recombinase
MILADFSDFLGNLSFGIMLGVIGVVGGYMYCRKGKARE